MTTRQPAVAGSFYPADPAQLRAILDRCEAQRATADWPPPKALIAPHAGYVYSGPVAASAYAPVAALAGRVDTVILLGPSHHFAFEGFAVPAAGVWSTPLGPVAIDREQVDLLGRRRDVIVSDAVHAREHSLEVHLPFLQRALGSFRLVPVAVGQISPAAGADLLAAVWGGDETLVVVSTDLSHFLPQDAAERVDRETTTYIESLDADAVVRADACGRYPVAALIALARERHMRLQTVDLRTSADTAGGPDRVVGYGSYLLWPKLVRPKDGRATANSTEEPS